MSESVISPSSRSDIAVVSDIDLDEKFSALSLFRLFEHKAFSGVTGNEQFEQQLILFANLPFVFCIFFFEFKLFEIGLAHSS